jgi:hypothetical protein
MRRRVRKRRVKQDPKLIAYAIFIAIAFCALLAGILFLVNGDGRFDEL